jgi:tRNA 2-thiocytidine biosynthesis protein TtcA
MLDILMTLQRKAPIKFELYAVNLDQKQPGFPEHVLPNYLDGGKLKSMPPKLVSDDQKHVVIRPLAYCKEADIAQYSQHKEFPIIPCNLCGSQENLQRQNIKSMLNDWDTNFPGRIESMFTAMKNVVPSHLADAELFDFKTITADSKLDVEGDIAFDEPTIEGSFAPEADVREVQTLELV